MSSMAHSRIFRLVLLLLFVSIVLATECQATMQRSFTPTQLFKNQNETTSVFVLTMPRSGSTFVGELFKQNDEFAYLFEVTRGLGEVHEKDQCAPVPEQWEQDIVKDMFNCKFSPLQQYMNNRAREDGGKNAYLYSWGHSEGLSSKWSQLARCSGTQGGSANVAIKEITMWGPKLKWLYDAVGDKLRIIWLVRDIRGWVSSWLPVKNDKGGTDSFYDIWGYKRKNIWAPYEACGVDKVLKEAGFTSQNVSVLRALMSDTNHPAHKRMAAWWAVESAMVRKYLSAIPSCNYMLVSYEHMSLYPLETAQQIYSFMGRDVMPYNVLHWLLDNTQGHEDGDKGTSRYGTVRNSETMASVWRQRLSDDQLREIEEIAMPLFDFFEYIPYTRDTAKATATIITPTKQKGKM